MPLDSQQIEVLGRNLFISALLRDGIEVATPIRDNGIDLLVYKAFHNARQTPKVVPIQLKCSSGAAWGIKRRYETIKDIRLVHVWNLATEIPCEFYCLSWSDANSVLMQHNYTPMNWDTPQGSYAANRVTQSLRNTLSRFKVVPGGWTKRLFG